MARSSTASTGSQAGGGVTLVASKTILVLAPNPHRCGELVGALQRCGLPSVQATTLEEAMYWAAERPPALAVIDVRTRRWRPMLAHLRGEGRAVVALADDPGERRMALEAGCFDATSVGVDAEELALKVRGFVQDRQVVPAFKGTAGPLEVNLVEGSLRWWGMQVDVPRQVLVLAATLVAHAGHPVPTRTLLQEIGRDPWSRPDLAHKAVWRLRRALGLTKESAFLRARRGYGYGIFPDAYAREMSSERREARIVRRLDEGSADGLEPNVGSTQLAGRSRAQSS